MLRGAAYLLGYRCHHTGSRQSQFEGLASLDEATQVVIADVLAQVEGAEDQIKGHLHSRGNVPSHWADREVRGKFLHIPLKAEQKKITGNESEVSDRLFGNLTHDISILYSMQCKPFT